MQAHDSLHTHTHTHILENGVKHGLGAGTVKLVQSSADVVQMRIWYTYPDADTHAQACTCQYWTHTKLQTHNAEQIAVAHQSADAGKFFVVVGI